MEETSRPELELSDEQVARIDEIHNAVYEMCKVFTEDEHLVWDMAYIGEIADIASSILVKQGHKVRYPAIINEPDGNDHIDDFVS